MASTKTKLKDHLDNKVQALQLVTSEEKTVAKIETEIVPVASNYIALTTNVMEIITENLKNQPLSYQLFDVIKSPSGGSTVFTVPTLSGEEIQKELTGIIIDYTTPRAYWETSDPVEGTPPNCYSRDSLVSHDGKPCSHCPFNEYGSKDGESNAKACKEAVEIFLLREDNIMPVIVRIPVSSKHIFQRYLTRLVSRMIPLCGVVTKITLGKDTNRNGQAYAQFSFETVATLQQEETAGARAYGQKFMEYLNVSDEPEHLEAV